MYIKIFGEATALSKEDMKDAFRFFAKKLMTPKTIEKLDIEVELKVMPRKGTKGMAAWLFDNVRPKDYEVIINTNQSRLMQLKTIAHEVVHIKQWVTGEMKDLIINEELVNFNGKRYVKGDDGDAYYFSPWEIEAYGREPGLINSYAEYIKTKTKEERAAARRKNKKRT